MANHTDAYSRIYEDPIPLFKELTVDDYKVDAENNIVWSKIDRMIKSGVFKQFKKDEEKKTFMMNLAKYIVIKDAVSYCIWYILLGIVTIQSVIIMILNENDCLLGANDNKSFNNFMKSS